MAEQAGDKDAKKGKNIHVKNIGIGSKTSSSKGA
jgi:hypothetical protein